MQRSAGVDYVFQKPNFTTLTLVGLSTDHVAFAHSSNAKD